MVKLLDKASEEKIAQAIREAESKTCGEIRVHLKRSATKDALAEAKRVFRRLGMHRAKSKTGVLIFISWKSRSFAVVGDEGIYHATGDAFWNGTRDRMQADFVKGELASGILAGIHNAGEELKKHFPRSADDRNELPDTITEGK